MLKSIILKEISYKAIRSSGPGGQHANKVSSKVVLTFNLEKSEAFTEREKELLLIFFKSKLNTDGMIQLSSDENRSQFRNKKAVTERLFQLIEEGLIVNKPRKKTKPSRSAILKGQKAKKRVSEKKALRKKPKLD